jgi:hypothetical protein
VVLIHKYTNTQILKYTHTYLMSSFACVRARCLSASCIEGGPPVSPVSYFICIGVVSVGILYNCVNYCDTHTLIVCIRAGAAGQYARLSECLHDETRYVNAVFAVADVDHGGVLWLH